MLRWCFYDLISKETWQTCVPRYHLHFAIPAFEVFRNAVYAAHRDERRTGVHCPNYLAQIRGQDVRALGSPVPDDKDGHVSGESTCLQDQRNFDQDLTSHVFSSAICSICRFCCAVGDHQFDKEIDANESRQDPSWMNR